MFQDTAVFKRIGFLLLLFVSPCLQAEQITLKVEDDVIATAEYHSGEPGKPLVIFLHGFLQTRDFSTVSSLREAIRDSGYPVLAPTLSLGISNRAQSQPCEAIHLNSLESDAREISEWVSWAEERGYTDIVLVGHSAGSVSITAYLAEYESRAVNKTILISLTYHGRSGLPAAFETEEYAQKAREMLDDNGEELGEFGLAFCKKYVTTPRRFLSYYDWSDKKVVDAIDKSLSTDYVVFGGADDRITPAWMEQLEHSRAHIIVIDKASHFFDKSYEFDLHDTVEQILEDD